MSRFAELTWPWSSKYKLTFDMESWNIVRQVCPFFKFSWVRILIWKDALNTPETFMPPLNYSIKSYPWRWLNSTQGIHIYPRAYNSTECDSICAYANDYCRHLILMLIMHFNSLQSFKTYWSSLHHKMFLHRSTNSLVTTVHTPSNINCKGIIITVFSKLPLSILFFSLQVLSIHYAMSDLSSDDKNNYHNLLINSVKIPTHIN